MKQRVGGLVLGCVCFWACAVGCGGGDTETGSSENPGMSASAGMSSPTTAAGGSSASGGSKGSAGSAATGTAGTSASATPGASATGTAGAKAAAGSSAATAGSAAAGATANSGSAGSGPASGAAGASAGAPGSSAAGGCGSESFAAIYESIFKNTTYNCAGAVCHGREPSMAMTVGNLSLSSASIAYMQLVKVDSTSMACTGKTRVVPGDPANSLLVQKLRGANTMCGGPMPINAEEITDADLKRISDWISAGACDN